MVEKRTSAPVRRQKLRYYAVSLSVILLLCLLTPCIALSAYVLRHIDYHPENDPYCTYDSVFTAADFDLPEILHELRTSDGETLWCSEIRADAPKGVIIYLSGIEQPSVTYYYPHAVWMREHGYASFLLELRAHGNSSGHKIGLGYTETEDVRALIEHIDADAAYRGLPIVIQGVSMGGATAINAFGLLPRISACIACSPYASFQNQLDFMLAQYKIPPFLCAVEKPFLSLTLRILYGWERVDTVCPEAQIQNADARPILLIACTGDENVSVENTYKLHEAYPASEIWIRDAKDHLVVSNSDLCNVQYDTEYCNRILSFLAEIQ